MTKLLVKAIIFPVSALFLGGCFDTTEKGDVYYCDPSDAVQQMRIQQPANVEPSDVGPYPTIVFIPGHGLSGRISMSGMQEDMDAATENGYVAVTFNYHRKSSSARFLTMVDESSCAIRYLKENAEDHNIDPDKIGVFGHSMGGMPAWTLAVGLEPRDIINEAEVGHLDPTISGGILNQINLQDVHNNPENSGLPVKSMVASVVLSNTATDHLAAMSKGFYKFSSSSQKYTPASDTLDGVSELTCSNYYYNDSNLAHVDYPMIRGWFGGLDTLTCSEDEVIVDDEAVKIDTINIAHWMAESDYSRATRGSYATPVLIINADADTSVDPFNSIVNWKHFNAPELNRPATPLVVYKNIPHNYGSYNDHFISTYLKFFDATLKNHEPHQNLNYCEGAESVCEVRLP